jgi:ABC-type transporter lipoprotein component MlaA
LAGLRNSDDKYKMIRNVYVGAAEYMAGTPKPLEYGIVKLARC